MTTKERIHAAIESVSDERLEELYELVRQFVEPTGPGQARVAGLHAGAMQTSDDFDAPLPDEFWTGTA